MLTMQSLTCERGGNTLFQPLTMAIAAGEYVELMGDNGIGKSTLLRALAGLHSQFAGVFEASDSLYQGHRLGLDGLLTPIENLSWFAGLEEQVVPAQQILDTLQKVGVLAKAYDPCSRLSAGQQRRVAIARWMLSQRKLWLLDEPLTALDQTAQALMTQVIADHCSRGGVAICATHHAIEIPNKRTILLQASSEAVLT